jgi:hypothetical protein
MRYLQRPGTDRSLSVDGYTQLHACDFAIAVMIADEQQVNVDESVNELCERPLPNDS